MRLPYVQLKTTQGCLRENSLSILVFSAAGQSSSCGSTGGRIEARRHERWRVKGSQAGRGVQGGKRDDSIISQNRTIHELSCTLYRRHREVSDITHTVPGPNTAEQPYPRCTRLLGWQRIERKLACSPARTYGTWFCAVAVGRRPTARLAPPLPSLLGGIVLPTITIRSLARGAGRALAEAPTFVCPTIWTSSCALESSGSAGIGVGSQTTTAGAVSFAAANSSVSSSAPGATRSAASRTCWLRSHAL